MIKLLILDWDDTITLGATEGYLRCYHAALQAVGVHRSAEEEKAVIFDMWGRPPEKVMEALLEGVTDRLEAAMEAYYRHLRGNTFSDCVRPVPGVVEALQRLSEGYVLAVASSGDGRVLQAALDAFQVRNFFRHVVVSGDLPDPTRGKPHPDLALHLLAVAGVGPDEARVVGDGTSDVEMAQVAGIEPIVVLTGRLTREKAESIGVRCIISSLADLPNFLQQ